MRDRTHFGRPLTFRGPIGRSTEGPSGRARMRFHAHVGAPLTRFVAPYRAPPKAPVAGLACGSPPMSAHASRVSWPHRELLRMPQ